MTEAATDTASTSAQSTDELLRTELFHIGATPVTVATLVTMGLVLLATVVLTSLLERLVERVLRARGKAGPGEIKALQRILRYALWLLGLTIALSTAGVNLTALFAASAVFAVALGFAMQNIAENFVAGVLLLLERAIKPGDVLEVEGQMVKVVHMGIRTTVARTLDDEDLVIPNSRLVQSAVKNYTLRDPQFRVRVRVGVAYESDMKRVADTLARAREDRRVGARRAVAAGDPARVRVVVGRLGGLGLDPRAVAAAPATLRAAAGDLVRAQGGGNHDRLSAARPPPRPAGAPGRVGGAGFASGAPWPGAGGPGLGARAGTARTPPSVRIRAASRGGKPVKTKAFLILLLVLAAAAGGFWGARELERRRCAKEKAELRVLQSQALRAVRTEAESWADAIARRQAEAVLRAFVAGVFPSILADRREGLTISSTSLLRVPGVEGIHVLRPDGEILYSSNVKMTTTGEVGESGSWALAAPELTTRAGARQGSLELAVPLVDAGQVLAVVWLEYGLDSIRDAGRPAGLAPAESTPTAPVSPDGDSENVGSAPTDGGMEPAATSPSASGEGL